jgi:hypothetical protein
MDESTRKLSVRSLTGVLGVALVALLIWAGAALAAGGSSSSGNSTQSGSTTTSQTQEDRGSANRGDCPERSGNSGGSSSGNQSGS